MPFRLHIEPTHYHSPRLRLADPGLTNTVADRDRFRLAVQLADSGRRYDASGVQAEIDRQPPRIRAENSLVVHRADVLARLFSAHGLDPCTVLREVESEVFVKKPLAAEFPFRIQHEPNSFGFRTHEEKITRR